MPNSVRPERERSEPLSLPKCEGRTGKRLEHAFRVKHSDKMWAGCRHRIYPLPMERWYMRME